MATDDDSVLVQPPMLIKTLTESQLQHLAQIHYAFDSLLSGKLGLEISINTGNALHFQSSPYRIPVTLIPLVRAEIDMLASGVIEPSVSPWSSSIIPVKQKDGTIRVCINPSFERCYSPRPILVASD